MLHTNSAVDNTINPNQNINPNFGGGQNTPPSPFSNPPQPMQPPQPQPQPTNVPGFGQPPSPLEPPPPPQPVSGGGQGIIDLPPDQSPLVTEPRKRKFPLTLIIFLIVIIILAGVGYLAYQNYILKNKSVTPTTTSLQELPTPMVTPTPQIIMQEYTSKILPITLSTPSEWKVTETENPELGNQKKITIESPDFAYQEDQVASGYQLMIGPVNNLTKKFEDFASFAQQENADQQGQIVTINNIQWIQYPTSAKTLLDKIPLTVALYSGEAEKTQAPSLFTQILSTFKFVQEQGL